MHAAGAAVRVRARRTIGVSYTELGLALTAFNVVSTVVQTPAGFLVDRVERAHRADRRPAGRRRRVRGRRRWSIRSGCSWRCSRSRASATPSITRPTTRCCRTHVPPERAGRVFSFHTFAGMLGNAAAPATLLYLQSRRGLARRLPLRAAVLGVVAAIVLVLAGRAAGEPVKPATPKTRRARPTPSARRLAAADCRRRSCSISCSSSCSRCRAAGSTTIWSSTLGALYGTPATVANTALTGLLIMSAVGVLVGGDAHRLHRAPRRSSPRSA